MRQKMKWLGVMVLTMSLLLTGCGNGSKNSNDSNSDRASFDGASELLTSSEESVSEDSGISGSFSGDWEAEEEYGYSPFWLKYANLGDLEEKDLSDIMFCDKFTFGTELMDILTCYDYYEILQGTHILLQTSDLDEILNYSDGIVYPSSGGWAIQAYSGTEEDYVYNDDQIEIELYNCTDSELTLEESILNNQFYISFPNRGDYSYTNGALGIEFEETEFRTGMADVMDVLGKPTNVYFRSNIVMFMDREGEEETFSETVEKGGGSIIYDMLYDKGEYMLCVQVCESNNFGLYEGHSTLSYFTRDVYDYLNTTNAAYIVDEEQVYEFE